MSSTNKTTKLGLSQFLGTDKPAWLEDYNSDMQKIDDAYANLEQGGQSSASDIAALQQKDEVLTQDIADVNDRVDTASADLIAVSNRTMVLAGNYDTIHHELVLTNEEVKNVSDYITGIRFKYANIDNLITTGVTASSLIAYANINNKMISGTIKLHVKEITITARTELELGNISSELPENFTLILISDRKLELRTDATDEVVRLTVNVEPTGRVTLLSNKTCTVDLLVTLPLIGHAS